MRRGFEDDNGSGSGSDDDHLTDAQKEVQAFKSDRKRQKQLDRDEASAKPKEEDDGGGDDVDLMYERRADGTKKIVGVDGEEVAKEFSNFFFFFHILYL